MRVRTLRKSKKENKKKTQKMNTHHHEYSKSKFEANRFRGSRAMIGHTHKQTNYFIREERLLRKKG